MTASVAPSRRRKRLTIEQIVEMYEDAQRCAVAAGLRYTTPDEPGIRRIRRGRGFSYVRTEE